MKYLFSILLLTLASLSFGQTNSTISWKIDAKKIAQHEYEITFDATVENGWYVYSQYLESDDGPVRTEIVFDENEAINTEAKATEEGEKIEGFDELFSMNITKYKKHVTITKKVTITEATTVKGYITFMTCNDEQCLPPSDVSFELKLK